MNQAKRENDLLQSAVESYPLTPLPDGFVGRVMLQVRRDTQAVVLPKFRLQFLDVALPAFLALLVALIGIVGSWWMGALGSTVMPEIQFDWAAVRQAVPWIAVGVTALLGEVAVVMMVGVRLWLDRPFLTLSRPRA